MTYCAIYEQNKKEIIFIVSLISYFLFSVQQNILQINLHDEESFRGQWNSKDLFQSLYRTILFIH